MAASFEIANLSAWYGNKLAIEDMSLSVEPNQVTAFIGPSGCGKSTLVRCLNRMHELTPHARMSGKIVVDEHDICADIDAVQVRRRIGMVFQRPNPFPTMSIRDNVLSGLRLLGTSGPSRSEADSIAEEALRRSG